jgi:hypothetical protein
MAAVLREPGGGAVTGVLRQEIAEEMRRAAEVYMES